MSNQATEAGGKTREARSSGTMVEPDLANRQAGRASSAALAEAEPLSEDKDTLLDIFRQMLLIRRFEEKCAESYALGKIGGFCHLYIGQEA
ncbi:MAG TPA: hypothetical protein VEL78_01360, partial [Pyrinomonadaceae bacterium]|nr:hypothetical protein [Pyrinomonadaceae bacterium]